MKFDDLDKKMRVFETCRWRNANHRGWMMGPEGEVIPPRVIDKPPSAELREDQKDEDQQDEDQQDEDQQDEDQQDEGEEGDSEEEGEEREVVTSRAPARSPAR